MLKIFGQIYLIIAGLFVLLWSVNDIENSVRGHKASIWFACYHWFARLPMAALGFGLLWPFALGMWVGPKKPKKDSTRESHE
jgi:hypothetical protein